jgi:hypothetical protein
LLLFASKPKKRPQLINVIHTSEFLDPAVVVPLTNRAPSAEAVLAQMLSLGAETDCYALSAMDELDDKVLPLQEALAQTVGYTVETVLFCPTSRVGYYEGGHAKDRCIVRGRSRI